MVTPDDILEEEEEEEAENAAPLGGRIDRYEVFYRLGRGGMASVYLGRLRGQGDFERWVAVKQIHEHLAGKARFRDMFLDEAQVAAQLTHPHLVQVLDVGNEQGRPFLVMEFVNGETLGHTILRTFKLGRRMPLPLAVRLMASVCEGLHHAHELRDADGVPRGLVHRDISPHNILISYDGVVKVTDFGIVKAAGRATHTRTGVIKGKPQYMSPEQILAKPIDRRADIFALGIVLFETCLMKRLFKDVSDFAGLQRIVKGLFPRPSAVRKDFPPSLERVIMKALETEPDDRYQTARELQADLERYLLEVGEPLGTAEISEYMASIFQDRIKGRAELLTWIREEGGATPPGGRRQDPTLPGSSSSLPGPVVTGQDSSAEVLQPQGRGSKWLALLLVVFALGLAVGSGFWVVRSTATGSAPPEQINEPGEAGARPVPPVLSDKVAPEPRADAGAPRDGASAGGSAGVLVWGTDADAPSSDEHDAAGDWQIVSGAGADASPRPRVNTKRPPVPAAPPGTISVIANPWCEVYLGGRKLGRTPIMRATLPSGRQVLTFLPRGQRPGVRRTIKVRPNGHTPVSVNL